VKVINEVSFNFLSFVNGKFKFSLRLKKYKTYYGQINQQKERLTKEATQDLVA